MKKTAVITGGSRGIGYGCAKALGLDGYNVAILDINAEADYRENLDELTGLGIDWYYMQGKVLMALEQYESAHQAFREAVRRNPENNVYRSGALAAVVAHREAQTLHGKVKKAFKNIIRK